MVLKQVTWLQELIYMDSGQPAMYKHLMDTLFISAYLAVMTIKSAIKPLAHAMHLKELMGNADIYWWPVMRSYHAV